jgi:hemolysin activation/secretion protein
MKTRKPRSPARLQKWLACSLMVPVAGAAAQTPGPAAQDQLRQQQELLRQQERERALREQQEVRPDVRLDREREAPSMRLPSDETPCFAIDRIRLQGELAEGFEWALTAANPPQDPAIGRCLGTAGINTVMSRIQDAIIARGYVTTRVLAAPQDLKDGTLTLTVVPGRVRAIRFAEGQAARVTLANAVPASPGDLLNLRDIEQALENMQRAPTVAADIRIVPAEGDGAAPGQSDLVVSWQQRKVWRASLSLDDSGSLATGKVQAGATASLDNPLGLNDLFYVNYGHDVFNGNTKGTSSWTAHYDVPADYWMLGATASEYDYRQTVVGPFERYVYSGSSRNMELRASRVLYRNAKGKLGAYGRGWWRESDNAIDDVEILVQRRRMAGWELGFTHRHFMGAATLEASAAYRRGTGAFGALAAPEERFDEGTSRFGLITADAQITVPFAVGKQRLQYTGSWRGQWNRTPLVPQDRLAIGGRYTVRGFDGEAALTGERGWLLRNDVSLGLGGGQTFYIGADYGHVSGPATNQQLGTHLAGMALGLRGSWRGLAWDGFVGAPVSKPRGFPAAYTTFGFSMNWAF